MMDFPKRLVVEMVENGYIVCDSPGGGYASGREWVFMTASQVASWLHENAPTYGLAGESLPGGL